MENSAWALDSSGGRRSVPLILPERPTSSSQRQGSVKRNCFLDLCKNCPTRASRFYLSINELILLVVMPKGLTNMLQKYVIKHHCKLAPSTTHLHHKFSYIPF
jgi:hypothetical protein